MVYRLQWSAVLAFLAMVLSVVSGAMPEPYSTFLQACSGFVVAVATFLVAIGVITFVKLASKKLKL